MNGHDDTRRGLNAAVAATLNGERTAAGLTHNELAARSGVHPRTLMRLLKDQRDIDVNVMAKIAAVFNLTPTEVLAKAEDWQRRNQAGADVGEAARRIVAEARKSAAREGRAEPAPDVEGGADTQREA